MLPLCPSPPLKTFCLFTVTRAANRHSDASRFVRHQLSACTANSSPLFQGIAIDIASRSFNVLVCPTIGTLAQSLYEPQMDPRSDRLPTYRDSDELKLRRAKPLGWQLSQTCPNTRGCHISVSPTSHLRRRSWSKPVSAQCESYSILKTLMVGTRMTQ